MKVALFIPCLVDQAAPETGRAVVKVLRRLGCRVVFDSSQTCCGQALFNMGFAREARLLAMRFIRVFDDAEVVVAPSGSCVSMVVHHYAELDLPAPYISDWESLRERVFEFCSFLTDRLGVVDVGARFPHRVAYHASCHLLRDLGVKDQPRRLLAAVEGLEPVEGNWGDECCGFGGAFSVRYPALAGRIAERRAEALARGGAEFVTGADDSCLHHLERAFRRANLPPKTIHIARILAAREDPAP